jgi:DNA-directed RNA polymerase subunit RPC12/RpoP
VSDDGTSVICSRCGTLADDDSELPAGWSLETNERGVGRICATCTRSNIRSIEAKLPEEWWE